MNKNYKLYNKVVLDFDGIFASNMIYTQDGKWAKIFTWGIRHAVDMLVENGFEVHIITGDSTQFGQNISKKFTENIKIKSITCCNSKDKLKILKKKFDLNEIIYSGDDIYDIEMFKHMYGITHKDTHESIARHARYVSKYTPNDYYFTDLALHILSLHENANKHVLAEHLAKESTMEPMTDYLKNLQYEQVFILQQYSMRNHSDNTYNPLLDGNLNLTLHRLYEPIKHNERLRVFITIPNNCNEQQLKKLEQFVNEVYGENRIVFVPYEYGLNALENKKKFSQFLTPAPIDYYDLVISDFSNVVHFKDAHNVIYNFNISKAKGLDRAYIDPFFTEQLETVSEPCQFIYTLNENQKEYFISQTFHKSHAKSKLVVDKKIVNTELLEKQRKFYNDEKVFKAIASPIDNLIKGYDLALFFPFRLSDPCYNFEGLIDYLSTIDKKVIIIITDPNDSLQEFKPVDNVDIYNIKNSYPDFDTKEIYFGMLYYLMNRNNVYIPIFEDPRDVLHQSILEIFRITTTYWDTVVFLDKDNFNFETLTNPNNKKEIKEYINKLYY